MLLMNAHLFWACFRIFIITDHQNAAEIADPHDPEPRPAHQMPASANDHNRADDGKSNFV